MKHNISIAIGVIKTYFIQAVMGETPEHRKKSVEQMAELLSKHLIPVRPYRVTKRQSSVNKSRRSYRYTY